MCSEYQVFCFWINIYSLFKNCSYIKTIILYLILFQNKILRIAREKRTSMKNDIIVV